MLIHPDINARRADYAKIPPGCVLVSDIFYTLQGEGPFAGLPAIFVRLAGCNLGAKESCPWCDTAFQLNRGTIMNIATLLHKAYLLTRPGVHKLMVLTGGEPLLQPNVHLLIEHFLTSGWEVQVETNGYFWSDELHQLIEQHAEMFWVVVSPKVNARNIYPSLPSMLWQDMDCLKILLDDDPESAYFKPPGYAFLFDGEGRPVYLSPITHYKKTPTGVASFWDPETIDVEKCRRNHRYAAAMAKELGWRLNLQTHLYCEVP